MTEAENLLQKRADETEFQYHKRILRSKLVDKTIDFDYSTLAPFLYGKEYSSDVARRMAYGSLKTINLMETDASEKITSDSIISELDAKQAELKKERQRFFDQRREFNKILTTVGRQEHLYERLAEAAESLNKTVGGFLYSNDECTLKQPPVASERVCSTSEAVLVFSDWHYGMTAENIFNTYNTKICKERVANIVNQAVERLLIHSCRTLHILVLGDLFHGAIHTSARVASEELVCDQIMQVSEILARSILELSKYVDNVVVHMTYGNHARTVQNKKENIHRDNMERLVPWWLEQRFSNHGSIKVANDEQTEIGEFIFTTVCGHGICASHGDLDSVKTAPRLLSTLFQKKTGKDIEYIILGDKHHTETFEELGVTASICGSLCGVDDYANDKRLYSNPSQMLLIVNDKYGVDAEYRLKCEIE